ncbi:MAG: hypothetical protein FWH12_01105 [Treponema sp.]|nr:hypothetical protein [Treponema sp.]
MPRQNPRPALLLGLLVAALVLSGCSTLVERGGRFLEGPGDLVLERYRSSSGDLELTRIRGSDGVWGLEIRSRAWPALSLRGTNLDGGGNFSFTQAIILSSHLEGWNEVVLDLQGQGRLQGDGDLDLTLSRGGLLLIPRAPQRLDLREGRMRLGDARQSGEGALRILSQRRERILALTAWMDDHAQREGLFFYTQEEWASYFRGLLFPELLRRRERPKPFTAPGARWRRAGGIRWNESYTEFLLPPELHESRNSSTLLRDWEEALDWIYLEYAWDMIIAGLHGISLYKTP